MKPLVAAVADIVAMFANMDLLKEAGWDHVPQTYEDLTACCDALVAKGIIPFGCAGKETWCVTEYLEPIIEKTIGYEALNKIFAGQGTWNDPAATTRSRPTSSPARPPSIRTAPGTAARSTTRSPTRRSRCSP